VRERVEKMGGTFKREAKNGGGKRNCGKLLF
jgi:signal transduction histidine kinase